MQKSIPPRVASALLFAALVCAGCTTAHIISDPAHFIELLERSIKIEPERACAPYDRDDYFYPQSIEEEIIARQDGRIYSPYTKAYLTTRFATHIEHIVAISEAHDSGLCGRPSERAAFASDLLNLTLAAPAINSTKGDKDFAEWRPDHNVCWFAARIVAVKQAWKLTMNPEEAAALKATLENCGSVDMEY